MNIVYTSRKIGKPIAYTYTEKDTNSIWIRMDNLDKWLHLNKTNNRICDCPFTEANGDFEYCLPIYEGELTIEL